MDKFKKPQSLEEHWDAWIAYRRHYEGLTRRLLEQETESPIEAILYLHLRDWMIIRPVLVRTQVPIGSYRVDFLLSTLKKQLVIECDGHDFHEKTKKQAARDKKRDRDLIKMGYTVIRYTGTEICNDVDKILFELDELLLDDEE
ncbi:endonuclease domain-containing protein [Alicyclobacillus sp. SO9]|uniref:endonuclease domain-containing protein n=1 Tax=Alicyclobacillus sp. SO9 TaxID=2665646 RepID=UPI0018E76F59|nr:DUF559 domain-containing protein [Alicyclobacillus sp. SO9]QQE80900.1 DUF559 domain-containing protein [Alicyclobacillus sp. SO9]